jgi:hypothetical protein
MAEILVSSQSPGHRSVANSDAAAVRLPLMLGVHAVIWTIASALYRSNLDWAGDMLENYAWGIEWQAGYYKHPPFFAWVTAAWFSIFPRTDMAYFALSNANAMVGLCGIVALARRFLPAREAAVAGLAMAVSPIYTTLAIKFNANTILLSVWPWTAYLFVRYVQTGTRKSAMALGAMAAVAMLAKYFSVALLAGLALAGLMRPAWRARLLRPQSLLAVMAGSIVLWPHLHWLIQNGMPTFSYASHRMHEIERPLPVVIGDLACYALVQVAYLLPSMVFLLLLARRYHGQAAKLMLHAYVRRSLDRDLWWLAMGTFFAICTVAVATSTQLSSLWGNTQWFALAAFWVAILRNAGIDLNLRRVQWVMAFYWVMVLGLSAGGGYMKAMHHNKLTMEPRAELARESREVWRHLTSSPLAIVSGTTKEARSVAFYGHGTTRYWDLMEPGTTPWLSVADVRRDGALFICRDDDDPCQRAAASFSAAEPEWISVRKTVWGFDFPPRRYVLFVMPPKAGRG